VQINLAVIIQQAVATQGCVLMVMKLTKWPSFQSVYLRMDIFTLITLTTGKVLADKYLQEKYTYQNLT